MDKTYLTTKQVAELFKVDNSTIRRWSITGKIECQTTNGGHRKFSFNNIIEFIGNNAKKNELDFSSIINVKNNLKPEDYTKLITKSALNRNVNQIDTIIIKLYLEGTKISNIFDNYIDVSLGKIQDLLDYKKISIAEEHIARKTISKSLHNIRSSISKTPNNNKSTLCLNLENDIPDLSIDMIQIILEELGYNVHNAGSNTSILNLPLLLEKNNFSSLYIYMCDRQCCSATVITNINKTVKDLDAIADLCEKYKISLFIGGPGTKFIDQKISFQYEKFKVFSDLTV